MQNYINDLLQVSNQAQGMNGGVIGDPTKGGNVSIVDGDFGASYLMNYANAKNQFNQWDYSVKLKNWQDGINAADIDLTNMKDVDIPKAQELAKGYLKALYDDPSAITNPLANPQGNARLQELRTKYSEHVFRSKAQNAEIKANQKIFEETPQLKNITSQQQIENARGLKVDEWKPLALKATYTAPINEAVKAASVLATQKIVDEYITNGNYVKSEDGNTILDKVSGKPVFEKDANGNFRVKDEFSGILDTDAYKNALTSELMNLKDYGKNGVDILLESMADEAAPQQLKQDAKAFGLLDENNRPIFNLKGLGDYLVQRGFIPKSDISRTIDENKGVIGLKNTKLEYEGKVKVEKQKTVTEGVKQRGAAKVEEIKGRWNYKKTKLEHPDGTKYNGANYYIGIPSKDGKVDIGKADKFVIDYIGSKVTIGEGDYLVREDSQTGNSKVVVYNKEGVAKGSVYEGTMNSDLNNIRMEKRDKDTKSVQSGEGVYEESAPSVTAAPTEDTISINDIPQEDLGLVKNGLYKGKKVIE